MFSCFCFTWFPVVYLLYPETCRRTLEDMEEIFKNRGKIFVFRDGLLTQRQRPQEFIDAERRRVESDTEESVNIGGYRLAKSVVAP